MIKSFARTFAPYLHVMAPKSYSQLTAFRALTIAALRSISKSPSAVIFTIAFPLIFILVFGFIGGDRATQTKIGMLSGTDSAILQLLPEDEGFQLIVLSDTQALTHALTRGDLDVIMYATPQPTKVSVQLVTMEGEQSSARRLKASLGYANALQHPEIAAQLDQRLSVVQTIRQGAQYKAIDFVLPGQLGFSLLASSIFGTAFVFFSLRQGLVLKRFFATPIKKHYILLSEGMARMIFQLLGALVIICIGYFFLGFTLIHGWLTVLHMMLISAFGLLVFMSIGFIISGIAKSESTIPPLSNIFTLPQFLLAGTFFPIDAFPSWLQPISRALPLTYLNDALRQVAFEGASLWAVKTQLIILVAWGLLGYFVASRVFKWE